MSIVGAVSPPGGDFSDPVTSATLGIVQVGLFTYLRNYLQFFVFVVKFFLCKFLKKSINGEASVADPGNFFDSEFIFLSGFKLK